MRLLGPAELGELSKVVLRVRDDMPDRSSKSVIAGDVTPQQIRNQIWGPWKLQRGVDSCSGSDSTGRTSSERSLQVGEDLDFIFDPTRPGSWMMHEGYIDEALKQWKVQQGTLLRLTIECWHDNWEQPWILKPEIDTDLRDKEKVVVEI